MNKIILTNIQRFSLHDGPGIRTTVFLKGCSLRCPWCSNPENQIPNRQSYIMGNSEGVYGKYYTAQELVDECLKDCAFYTGKLNNAALWAITQPSDIESLPGGVTFSGGECLLQMEKLVPVTSALHERSIHIAVETSLFAPKHNLQLALQNIDLFYVDMKILNPIRCKEVEKGNLDLFLSNLDTLFNWKDEAGKQKPTVIRVPVIGYYTDGIENRSTVRNLIKHYGSKIIKIELIKEHYLAESKYRSLGIAIDYHGVEDSLMEAYRNELMDLGIPIEICKI